MTAARIAWRNGRERSSWLTDLPATLGACKKHHEILPESISLHGKTSSVVYVASLDTILLPDSIEKSVNERRLCMQKPLARLGGGEPSRPVNLREGSNLTAPRRPFHFESIGGEGLGIKISRNRPSSDTLAARLGDLTQGLERAFGFVTGLLSKFAFGGCERIFALGALALGDRP